MIFSFQNSSMKDVRLFIEPWAEEFSIPENAEVEIHILANEVGPIGTKLTEKLFVVDLCSKCTARVYVNNVDVTPDSLSIPAI